jgi:micrococcal nuclease
VSVTDGDTIRARVGGVEERIRYIGIDTPERGRPCFEAASRANAGLLERGPLRLEYGTERRDRYGRLLAYVYAGDVFVNAELVRRGFARRYTVPPNLAHAGEFGRLERVARRENRGCPL